MDRKLILIELNEVPYRVLDMYCSMRPRSVLARILKKSRQYQTVTEDKIALDPWVSWPTLHRGVTDEDHQILHLGQVLSDVDLRFPPVWQILRQRRLEVGVFGSMHSSSVPADAAQYSFYLPDYFGAEAFAHPTKLLPFQELNLGMTRESARNVSRKIPLLSLLKFLGNAPRLGLRFSTIKKSAMHLVREAGNKALRIRRRAYQPLIMMDLFMEQIRERKPNFATFYTNHVAAAMHRYWGASFPEDYGSERLDEKWIKQYGGEILFSMDMFDSMMKSVVEFVDDHPEYVLMIASSMGQAAIPAMQTYHFLTITDVAAFLRALGVPDDAWELKPAMVPCYCVVVKEQYRDAVIASIDSLSIGGASMVARTKPASPMSYDERERGFFQFFIQFDNYAGPDEVTIRGRTCKLSDIGVGLMEHEDGVNCTAQHVPEGSLWTYGAVSPQPEGAARIKISTLDVAPSILEFFGVPKPSYMRGSASIKLAS